jgi:uncharacterized integral membrane protein
MQSKTRSAAPGVIPDPVAGPLGDGAPAAGGAPARAPAVGADAPETRRGEFRRRAHRTRLHGYAIASVALVAYLIALAATNTAEVKVNWVFGSAHLSLVWLVLFAAILGWLLGLVATAAFHWRTRAPRRRRGARS